MTCSAMTAVANERLIQFFERAGGGRGAGGCWGLFAIFTVWRTGCSNVFCVTESRPHFCPFSHLRALQANVKLISVQASNYVYGRKGEYPIVCISLRFYQFSNPRKSLRYSGVAKFSSSHRPTFVAPLFLCNRGDRRRRARKLVIFLFI